MGDSQGFVGHPGEKLGSMSSLHQGQHSALSCRRMGDTTGGKLLEGPVWYGVCLLYPTPQKVPSPMVGLPMPLGKVPYPVPTAPAAEAQEG